MTAATGVLAIVLAATGATWPDESAWQPVLHDGEAIGDVCSDHTGQDCLDIVGDADHPAAWVHDDGTRAWFRMRVADIPVQDSGSEVAWDAFGWIVLLETDGDRSAYDFAITLDGNSDTVTLYDNSDAGTDLPADSADEAVAAWAAPVALAGADEAEAAGYSEAGSDLCEGDGDWFVDMSVPWSELTAWTGATELSSIGLAFGTGSNGRAAGQDLAGCDGDRSDCDNWGSVVSDYEGDDAVDTGEGDHEADTGALIASGVHQGSGLFCGSALPASLPALMLAALALVGGRRESSYERKDRQQ